jgi:hypothetical protein
MTTPICKSRNARRIPLEGPILVAHQPEFLPWLGFFSKAAMGDVYLIHDVDQYKKKTFENRNKIRIYNKPGWMWLTAAVGGKSQLLNMGCIRFSDNIWRKKAIKAIELSYKKAPFFEAYFDWVCELILFPSEYLRDFNVHAIRKFFDFLDLSIPVFRSSELMAEGHELEGKATDAVISMCKWFKAKTFVAGIKGKDYLERKKFREADVQLVFQLFEHPVYRQHHGEFIPGMSFIDLLFNHGPKATDIIGKSDFEF